MSFEVAEVQRQLRGADYPMDGEQLAQLAERNGADETLVDALRGIGGSVDGPTAVMEQLQVQLRQ